MTRSWCAALLFCLSGSAAAFACTFGANDFKVVPAAAGGAAGSAGSTGEGGAAGENAGCVKHDSVPLLVLSAADLHQASVDRFAMVPGTAEVFAIAFVTIPNGAVMQTHALIRTIADANFGTVRGIADMTMPGTFLFGGAWATATEIDIVGADQRGIVQLTVPINALGNADLSMKTNLVVTTLDTPVDCAQTVHSLRIARNITGTPSFVATCVPDATKPTEYSLWYDTPGLTKTTQLGVTGANVDNIARFFVRNGPSGATTNLILVGNDGTAASDFRTGNSPTELKTVSALTMTTDPGWLQQVQAVGLPAADGGAFMMVTKFHDPTKSVTPLEVWAGSIASSAYGLLTAVPPTQLKLVTTASSAADAFFPQEWTIRGSSVHVVAEDQISQHNLVLWTLDQSGGPLSATFPVYSSVTSGNVLTNPRIAQLTLADVVGWVETSSSAGSVVYASSISCP
ncbi:MAG TPA: hypothetical protein VNW92_30525 [Polyangiaceae bacterium]|nr:hypothetical protein [Polyangiaceae bacterium]